MEKIIYEKPLVEVVDVFPEGIICDSGNGSGEGMTPGTGTW